MPKLYYSCSNVNDSSLHAAFTGEVAGLECEEVDLTHNATSSGDEYDRINPKMHVPCLVFKDGTVLNDKNEILHYIAEHQVSPLMFHQQQ